MRQARKQWLLVACGAIIASMAAGCGARRETPLTGPAAWRPQPAARAATVAAVAANAANAAQAAGSRLPGPTDPNVRVDVHGRPNKLTSRVETQRLVRVKIHEQGQNVGADGEKQQFDVDFSPPINTVDLVTGEVQNSDPIFYLEGGWAYFSGKYPRGSTRRVRAIGTGTEFYIVILDLGGANENHRVINVSDAANECVDVECVETNQLIAVLQPGWFIDVISDDCEDATPQLITGSREVQDWLREVGGLGLK